VEKISEQAGQVVLRHALGRTDAGLVICCAGAWADRLAEAAGADPEPRIVPFRGAFKELTGRSADLVRASIYPVPDPELPFLGAHVTRGIDGRVLAGPTALPAGAPDAHDRRKLELRSLARTLSWPGSRRLARQRWRSGAHELAVSSARGRLAADLRRLVPGIAARDLRAAGGGVRAQAVARDGSLIDDFVVSRMERTVHVRNAPSPAATACLPLAELIADQLGDDSPL
jgi:L-2-hydroxyglutarate oxidase LhgO